MQGIHPIRIADGFEMACQHAIAYLETISDRLEFSKDNIEPLYMPATASLSSKMSAYYLVGTHSLSSVVSIVMATKWRASLSKQFLM